MTVMQVGDPSTLKGHPTFMQACNAEWHKVDQKTRDGIKSLVHLDKTGKVVRIDGPGKNKKLEDFVRRFANGRTYIGVGSWNGNPGNPNDNQQVRAITELKAK